MIEWIPHDSDECPVKPGALVEADYGGAIVTTVADSVDWQSVRRYRVRMPEGYADARTVPADDGWIDWAGGECPVHPDTKVEVELRRGGGILAPHPVRAGAVYWHHDGYDGDVTRYRIVRPPLDFHTSGAPVRADDVQQGGDHYRTMDVQPWAAMQAWMTPEQFAGYLRGCALKYIARAGSKGPTLDEYRKARHYLDKLIETMEQA